MLNDWHHWQNWLLQFQQFALALMVVVLCLALLVLWNDLRRLTRSFDQTYVQTQKALRELGQQRYALADLRQAMIAPERAINEKDLFTDAMNQLDGILKSLPADVATPDTKSVDDLKDREILTFVKKALRDNQIALATQPVKSLPLEQSHFYEVYSRIQIGTQYIPAGKFLTIAKDNGLMALIDQAFLMRTLQQVQKTSYGDALQAYFCNISASSFSNKPFLEKIIAYLENQPRLSARLIFELSQDDTFQLNEEAKAVFMRLVELGCRFSMDNVTMFGLDIDRLRKLHLSFVKFNVDAVLKEIDTPQGRRRWVKTRTLLASHGIEVIVEKVENAKQMDKLSGSGFNYAQGYYFGKPEIIASSFA